jgi:hypothetical protein
LPQTTHLLFVGLAKLFWVFFRKAFWDLPDQERWLSCHPDAIHPDL